MNHLLISCSIVCICLVSSISRAQQPSPASLRQALGMAPDTLQPLSPTRPDTTQLNSADRPDTVRQSTPGNAGISLPATRDSSQTSPAPTQPGQPAGEATAATGTLRGRLVTVQGGKNQPIEFASVGVFRTRDSSSVTGGLTDENGYFSIANLSPDIYYILIQSLGYAPKRIPRITVSADNAAVNLGNVIITETSQQLEEVVVQGQRQAYEYSLDRKIVNVDQLPIAQGGSAVDILLNVPSVTLDVDGVLSLRGSSNVIVLVDGKPSGLTGLDRQAILEQIPASNIERIEIITNPSSRFDADGAAGIINIVLKKERAAGFNGTVQLNVGTRDKYNASINLNARFKKLNLFGSYNFREDRRFQYRISDRQNLFTDSTSFLAQRNDAVRRRVNNNLRLGFDYTLSERDNITVSALYRPGYSYDSEVETFDTQDENRLSLGQIYRTNEEREPERGIDYTLGYRRTFPKKGRELSFDATLSTNKGTEFQRFTNTTTLPETLLTPNFLIGDQRATNDRDNRVGVLQLDYVEPLKGKKRLEGGLKYTTRQLGANYVFENLEGPDWVLNPGISNNFIYDEQTSAAYVNLGNELKKFSYQVGLRTEYTSISTDQRTTSQRNTTDYIYLFPSAFVNYNLSQAQKLQINYTRRINRPSVRVLNPFIDLSDPLNIRFGNPLLNPELINSFELSHLWNGKSTSLTSSLFFRQTNNEITNYRTLREDGITEQTSLNLNRSQNYGLEVVLNQDITRWWKASGNFSFFQRSILASADVPDILSRTNRSWTGRVTFDLKPTRQTAIQLVYNYRSPFLVAQGTINSFTNVDLGVKQTVLKGRGTLSLRVSDVFNTLQFQSDSFGPNFLATSLSKRESRIGFIGFSYRLSRQISREQDRDNDDRQPDNPAGDPDFSN
ncbi:TonB-dependent receptor domain-containing protein [Spirosoma sordidisoli]|uniref:TonB-dependent receptor n=1 Tax=Spirosoma sordidisoli TaxID=2502893 RepID=A0A4Q2UIK8_9BACT|nr:TonB-dependent receptor [Spirosoma sordidisoli]RYC67082.1 TonB-dependent receptor [Spirosoma sordidisoli]RYC67210.1 TonB-dependent receptor [Spirosoma sordidisoli]